MAHAAIVRVHSSRSAVTDRGNPSRVRTLHALRAEIDDCRACPLWAPATQAVCGEGSKEASLLFVGEQPGDQEDLAGRPFIGPAGRLFDRALAEAGIERAGTYVTNAVKHFKFLPRGKRRIHQKPNTSEIRACHPWLEAEIALVAPRIVVALGATAAQAVLGKATSIRAVRGRLLDIGPAEQDRKAFVTVHPSYLLRLPEAEAREAEYRRFVEDLARCRMAVDAP